ncbi:HlyD family efflux transporter periplasmic adaptor subunit [Streptomyces sp. SL13]|uniref:HlyD family efflux transporter periplasmic adaptor subunit n=1 Tax=Streptantibioticus silvisoli TaxID=2705255 RepID=A0AA90H9U9_9ACTN|nr:HlyD family efflux transporter periplasmic adaptor subunit [Streptantibioticus silvisoli]MDI5973538.1 HlyD family efflux transporter periplasmic adaptor subunit [Streptantibioticus silvisoli]
MEFRRNALENLRQPDDLDSPVRLARPRAWAVLAVVGAIIVGGLVWSLNGELARSVTVPGVLTYPMGVSKVVSPSSGTVAKVFVSTGKTVSKGAPVLSVVDAHGVATTVEAPFSGPVVALLTGSGQYVTAGTAVMTVEQTDGPDDPLVAVLFAPADKAALLAVDDRVDLDVASAPAAAFGLMRGRVSAMERFPQTGQQVRDFVGGDELLATRLLGKGDPVRITVRLDRDTSLRSGYRWTTASGPAFRITPWTQVSAICQLPGERPIDWLLPR